MRRGFAIATRSDPIRTVQYPEVKGVSTVCFQPNQSSLKPRPIYGFTIDRETLNHLPPLHKAAAEIAIADGRWRLV